MFRRTSCIRFRFESRVMFRRHPVVDKDSSLLSCLVGHPVVDIDLSHTVMFSRTSCSIYRFESMLSCLVGHPVVDIDSSLLLCLVRQDIL